MGQSAFIQAELVYDTEDDRNLVVSKLFDMDYLSPDSPNNITWLDSETPFNYDSHKLTIPAESYYNLASLRVMLVSNGYSRTQAEGTLDIDFTEEGFVWSYNSGNIAQLSTEDLLSSDLPEWLENELSTMPNEEVSDIAMKITKQVSLDCSNDELKSSNQKYGNDLMSKISVIASEQPTNVSKPG
jgi:hypothetical protein